ncbi:MULTISPECIES: class II aldolase/adducin family protein [Rhodococcus]|uniref:Class II aldolase/adducin family protein n=1 Tax=Rhodococcus qingshengii JCM 15477 TaxID=1303681 RepID=A0AB38RE96_RHOSG|nr:MULTISPECIES: class II aldolase/adducin family protein [Rhodococcus]UPU43467.1 class II aldolase/adducin family protein [Rhodococcus qingshengii JCM 15477]
MNHPLSNAEQAGIPGPPEFTDIESERRRRKTAVIGGYRILSKFGLDEGISGHITARDPEDPETFWTAPFGRHFSQVQPEELLHVASDGAVISGDGPLNRAAFVIHSKVHEARPDVIGAVHAHGLNGKAFSSLHTRLAPITQDACAFHEDHSIYEEYHGVALDEEEGIRIADALGSNKAVILTNHGHLTVGTSVESAVWWYVSMERSMQAELTARAAGDPVVLHEKIAAQTYEAVGTEKVGWFAYSTIIQKIAADEPEVFAH